MASVYVPICEPLVEASSPIIPTTNEEYDSIKQKERARNKILDIQKFTEVNKPEFVNDLILYFGKEKSNMDDSDSDNIRNDVTNFMTQLLDRIASCSNFVGHLVPCGSMAEGTKIKAADEFDFIYEASLKDTFNISQDQMWIEQSIPETFKTRSQRTNLFERSYFKIGFKCQIPDWCQELMKCRLCKTSTECTFDHKGRYLSSRALLEKFVTSVQRAATDTLRHLDSENTFIEVLPINEWHEHNPEIEQHLGESKVTQSGPAANIFVKYSHQIMAQ